MILDIVTLVLVFICCIVLFRVYKDCGKLYSKMLKNKDRMNKLIDEVEEMQFRIRKDHINVFENLEKTKQELKAEIEAMPKEIAVKNVLNIP